MRLTTFIHLAARIFETHIRKTLRRSVRPYKLLLELTYSCNSKCNHCSIWKIGHAEKRDILSINELQSIFEEIGPDLLWLSLSGGEITLYDQFEALVEIIRTRCRNLRIITFTTNGLLPEKALRYAKLLKTLGTDLFITVSLDGDEATHDKIRGISGSFSLAKNTFDLLTAAGIRTHFGITLGDYNNHIIGNFYTRNASNIKSVTFAHSDGIYRQKNPLSIPDVLKSLEHVLQNYIVNGFAEYFEKIYLYLAKIYFKGERKKNIIPCEVINTSIHIRPNGHLLPCMFLPSLGKVPQNKVHHLLRSDQSIDTIRSIKQDICPHCWMNCYAPHSMLQHPVGVMWTIIKDKINIRFRYIRKVKKTLSSHSR